MFQMIPDQDESSRSLALWNTWPDYASVLSVELVEDLEPDDDLSSHVGKWLIQFRWNGQCLQSHDTILRLPFQEWKAQLEGIFMN